MAINGSLDEASLADVLQLLSLGQKTGRLSVSDQSNLGHIYLEAGKITHAFLVSRQHRLGDILFKSGRITQDQLNEAMRLQEKSPEKKLGEILVETGATSKDALSHCMQVQIEEAVYFLFTWRRGDFAFERDVKPDPQDFLVSINPEALLLEGARRVDEWSVIEKKIPSFDMVFTVDHARIKFSDAKLSDEQQRIASLLNGARDVAAIVAETGMIEFDVGQALYGLITAGFAEPVGPSQMLNPDGTVDERSTEHLDHKKLLAYLAHQAEFSDPKRHRRSGLHIADCPTCSKLLQKIHVRRSQGLPAMLDDGDTASSDPKQTPSDRRNHTDRRQSGTTTSPDQAVDRRIHGAGDRRSSTRTAAVQGRLPVERRRANDRRTTERRNRKRRMAAPVDRSDRAAVERRRGLERRLHERRAVTRRFADVRLQAVGGQRSTVPVKVGAGLSMKTGGQSGNRRNQNRQDKKKASATTSARNDEQKATGPSEQAHQQEPKTSQSESSPVPQPQTPKRPSVRRMRESPLRGLPLLADGTQWMFVERVDPDDDPLVSQPATPGSELPTPDATTTMPHKDEATTMPAPSQSSAKTTKANIAAPEIGTRSPESNRDAPKRKTSKWKSKPKAKDLVAEKAKRAIDKAKSEAENAKLEAEQVKSEAERAKAEAEKARLEAEKATRKAAKAESNAEKATTKAEGVKLEAVRRKSEAVLTRSQAKKAKVEVEKAKSEAEKAKLEAEQEKSEAQRAKAEADKARLEADEATTKADRVKLEAESVRSEAEKAKSEAEQEKSEAERTKSEAEQAKSEAERMKSAAEQAKSEAELAASRPRRSRSGRGTPVTLRQLVGSTSPNRKLASLDVYPAHTHHSDEAGSPPRKSGRTPVVWVALAAATVTAIATGWMARPFLETVFAENAPTLSTEAVPQSGEDVPVVISDTILGDSSPVEPAAEITVSQPAPVETQTTQPAAVAPEATAPPTDPSPAPAQPRLEELAAQPEPAVLPPPAPAAEEQRLDSSDVAVAVVPATTIGGSIREFGTGAPLAGALVSLSNTDLATTTDAAGTYSFEDVPTGSLTVAVELEGYVPESETTLVEAGGNIELDLVLRGPPSARGRDDELDGGQWAITDPAGAEAALGRPVAVISGLWIESVARPATGTRPRVRVAHLTDSGQRIILIVSRSGPVTSNAQPRVTALRIIPPTEAYPITTGTASFGGLLVTAKATLPAEPLRALLQRLVEADGG